MFFVLGKRHLFSGAKLEGTSQQLTWMDTQNHGLEKVDSFKIWPFLISMLDFWGVTFLEKREGN